MSPNDLDALRSASSDDAARFSVLVDIGRGLGVPTPVEGELESRVAAVSGFDIAALRADAAVLAGLTRSLTASMSATAAARVDDDLRGGSSESILGAMSVHEDVMTAHLDVLAIWSEATSAAADGIEEILRSWFGALADAGHDDVCGVRVDTLSTALADDAVSREAVVEEISSRVTLVVEGEAAAREGIGEIVAILGTLTDRLDLDGPPSGGSGAGPAGIRRERGRTPARTSPAAAREQGGSGVYEREGHLALAGDQ